MPITDKLSAIGDAIRLQSGKTAKLTLDQMPSEIIDLQALTFEVVGGTKPSNPKENTIWVDTDTEITGWHFGAEEPNVYNIQPRIPNDPHCLVSLKKLSDGDIINFTIPSDVVAVYEAIRIYDPIADKQYCVRQGSGSAVAAWPAGTKVSVRISNVTHQIGDWVGHGTAYLMAWDSYYHQEGTVWIQTGTTSPVAMNVLKKNSIQVCPISAKQYVGGAWVDKEAQIYQGGEWVDWLTYLVHDGIDNTNLTGGWFWNKSSAAASVSESDGAIRISCYNNYGAITWEYMTNNPVDLTEVKTIELLCDANASVGSWPSDGGGGGYIDLCCKSSKTENASATARIVTQSSVTGKTITLDVSNLSGNYYVSFYAYTYAERFYLSTNIYNLLFKK